MKFCLPTTLIVSALLASNVEARWKATPGHTWDYLLGAEKSVISASTKDVVTIDLEKAEEFAPYFHNKGQRVVCYFSGGTTETREYDKAEYQAANIALSGNGDGWGNQWLDIRNKAKLQPLIRKRMQRARKYGCDAVEVDCLGIYHYRDDYTEDDSYVFAKWVAETAHEEDISIGLKNVAGIAPKLEKYFDFAVVESCAESPNVCKYYTSFTDNNKAVFIVHYGNRGHKLSGSSLSNLIKEQGGHNFTCVLSDHQNLHHSSTNYDCDTGKVIGSGSSQSKTTTTKKTTTANKTTTVIKKTTTTTIKKTTTTTTVKKTTTTTSTTIKETTTTTTNASTESSIKQFNADNEVKSIAQVNQAANTINPVVQSVATASDPTPATIPAQEVKQATAGNQEEVKVASKEVGNSVSSPDDNEEGSGGVGTTAVAFVAAGGFAAAAVIGFLFVNKNNKF